MADQDGTIDTGMKKRSVLGKWTAQIRQEIAEASLVAGASINDVAAPKRNKIPVRFAAVSVNGAHTDGTIEIDLSNRHAITHPHSQT
jgi:hypothetical protein